jgi:phosphotransferase system enzyme I (PtsI)
MGLCSFSMHPAQIATIKQRILRTDTTRWTGRLQAILAADDPQTAANA